MMQESFGINGYAMPERAPERRQPRVWNAAPGIFVGGRHLAEADGRDVYDLYRSA